MKKYILLCAAIASVCSSCTKDNSKAGTTLKKTIGDDPGCAVREWQTISYIGSDKNKDSLYAVKLFQKNKVSFEGQVWYNVVYDSLSSIHYTTVLTYQYVNGLLLLNRQGRAEFRNEELFSLDNFIPPTVALDTVPSLRLAQVRTLYFSVKNITKPLITDPCVTAQFGYFDKSALSTGRATQLVKAWRVYIMGNATPVVYINDDDGEILFTDFGILQF